MNEKHPKVPGFLDDYAGTTRILCLYCSRLHRHGRSPGNRVPHCGDGKDLPEYDIVLVDISLPIEAVRIDREARRLHKVLQNRRHSIRITGSSKPDTAYEQEISDLAEAAGEFNERILGEVSHEE